MSIACEPIGVHRLKLVRCEGDEPLAATGAGPARRTRSGEAAERNRTGTEVDASVGTSVCEDPRPRGSSDRGGAHESLFKKLAELARVHVGKTANTKSGPKSVPDSAPKSVSDSEPKTVSLQGSY